MTSTLWFWIVCLIALLFVIWILRRIIGRVVIICIALFLIVIIWRWISPNIIDSVLSWFYDLPVRATNYVNTEILNKDIILPLNSVASSVDEIKDNIDDTIDEVTTEIDETVDIVEETVEEPQYSWFARLLRNDESNIEEDAGVVESTGESKKFVENRQQESVELKLSENGEVIVETITRSGDKIVDKVAKVGNGNIEEENNDVEVVVKEKNEKKNNKNEDSKKLSGDKKDEPIKKNDEKEENEVVYLKSNPKNPEKTTNTTKSSSSTNSDVAPVKAVKGLTAAEVREANEIFN